MGDGLSPRSWLVEASLNASRGPSRSTDRLGERKGSSSEQTSAAASKSGLYQMANKQFVNHGQEVVGHLKRPRDEQMQGGCGKRARGYGSSADSGSE